MAYALLSDIRQGICGIDNNKHTFQRGDGNIALDTPCALHIFFYLPLFLVPFIIDSDYAE
jgi:hypothetical protein